MDVNERSELIRVALEFAPELLIVMINSLKTSEVCDATLDQLLPARFEGPP